MKYTEHQVTYWYNISSQYALLENGIYLFVYLCYFIGIGNPEGSSVVVRYQHDINNLRDMVKSTLQGYDL